MREPNGRRPSADIQVAVTPDGTGWVCAVQISEGQGQTRHAVTVSREELTQLSGAGAASPEPLVRRSFEFLLERERKEFILRQFSLSALAQRFPDFPGEIRKRLSPAE